MFHNIFKHMIFQKRQKVLILWSIGLRSPNDTYLMVRAATMSVRALGCATDTVMQMGTTVGGSIAF